MPENTAKLTTFAPKTPPDGHASEQKEPWERQKNEPALWYMRFKRYLEMGPKRSLRAVYEAEPSTKKATKKRDAEKSLSNISIQGAWTRAAKVWNWTTRARAYDESIIEKEAAKIRLMAEKTPHASRAYRLLTLDMCGRILRRILEQPESIPIDKMSTYLAIIARYQSVMRDIAAELQGVKLTDLCDSSAMKKVREEYEARMQSKAPKGDDLYDRNKKALKWYEELEKLGCSLTED